MSKCVAPLLAELDVMEFVTEALRNPVKPSCCGGSLAMALWGLVPKDTHLSSYRDGRHLKQRNNFYEILYRFVVIDRPRANFSSFMTQFSKCADCSARVQNQSSAISTICHKLWKDKKDSFFAEMNVLVVDPSGTGPDCDSWTDPVICWYAFVQLAISSLSVPLANASFKLVAKSMHKPWPQNISKLIPSGPDDLVQTLIQGYSLCPQPSILTLLTLVTSLVRSPMHEALIKHKFADIVVNTTKDVVGLYIRALAERKPSQRMCTHRFTQQCYALFEFLEFFQGRYLSGDVKLRLMDGCETKALQVCSLALCLQRFIVSSTRGISVIEYESNPGLIERKAISYSLNLYQDFSICENVLKSGHHLQLPMPLVAKSCADYFGPVKGFEAELGLAFLWFGGLEYGCCSRSKGCQRYMEVAGRDFKLCDSCLGVYYCGKACQKADWTDAVHAHKKICPILSKVIDTRHRIAGPDSRRSNRLLSAGHTLNMGRLSVLTVIETVRTFVKDAKLSIDEREILKSWGTKLYHQDAIQPNEAQWHPGFSDYDAMCAYLCYSPFRLSPELTSFTRSLIHDTEPVRKMLENEPDW